MQAIVAPRFTDPSGYGLAQVDRPVITNPKDVIVEIYAASLNPIDVKLVSGASTFPLCVGYDCAGIVTEVGAEVKRLKAGDEVLSRLPEAGKGSWAQVVKASENHIANKPESPPWQEAASLPFAVMTSMQALEKYQGSLKGKTVIVPAGRKLEVGATGEFACQLAKNVFKAGKVITTVSTSKVAKVPEYLGQGVADQIIDCTKEDPLNVIKSGSVDFVLDTMGQAMSLLSLMTPRTSTIVSSSTMPSGQQLQAASFFRRPDKLRVPLPVRLFLDGRDFVRKARARRYGVNYTYMFLSSDAESLHLLKSHVVAGQMRPVIGNITPMRDIVKVREACMQVYSGKGGIGKTVIQVK